MATLAEIYDWFMTGKKPTQAQFWASWGSFWNKGEAIPQSAVSNLTTVLSAKTENAQFNAHKVATDAHQALFDLKQSLSEKGQAGGYVPLDEAIKIAATYLNIVNDLVTGGTTALLSAEQGKALQNQINGINTILTSDSINLDTVQEIVDAIEQMQTSIESFLVNDLTTGGVTKALTAEQGKVLKGLIDAIVDTNFATANLTSTGNRTHVFNNSLTINGTGVKTTTTTSGSLLSSVSTTANAINGAQLFSQNTSNQAAAYLRTLTDGTFASGTRASNGARIDLLQSSTGLAMTSSGGGTIRFGINGVYGTVGQVLMSGGAGSMIWGTPTVADATTTSKGITQLATDIETQISTVVAEDNKVVSRSKLFNWWEWIKQQGQTISGAWNFSNKITLATGTSTTPALIIPNGVLTTSPINGAIERGSNGDLWETHNGVRSRLITTADGLILIAYKSPNMIQINISGAISSILQSTSSSTVIGNIGNSSVLRLNAVNEVYFYTANPSGGATDPTVAKTEVFLKINNGLFAADYVGGSPVTQVKIMEFSGLNNNGFKNYQNPFITAIQNPNPLVAQWSTVQLVVQTINDGVTTNADKTYYLRDSGNTRAFGAGEAQFSFVFVNTVTYADGTNAGGQNTSKIIRLNNHSLFLETIR